MAAKRLAGFSLMLGAIAIASAYWSPATLQAQTLPSLAQSQTAPASTATALSTASLQQGFQHPLRLGVRTTQPPNHRRRLRIHNLCSQAIQLVVRYQTPEGTWQTQGNWRISGKTSRYLTTSSSQIINNVHGKVLYYYATAMDSDLVWSGTGSYAYPFEQHILNMRIHYAAVDILDDYSLYILCNPDR